MSKPKFTPGPWKSHAQGEANEYALLTHGGRWVISFQQNGEILTEQQLANARLISKAPDMYRLLRICEVELMPDVDAEGNPIGNRDLWERIRALLKEVDD